MTDLPFGMAVLLCILSVLNTIDIGYWLYGVYRKRKNKTIPVHVIIKEGTSETTYLSEYRRRL